MPVKRHSLSGAKEGRVFGIHLGEDTYGYVRTFRGSCLGVLPVITKRLLGNVDVLRRMSPTEFFFFAAPPDDPTPMILIGDIPFDDPEQAQPPACFSPPDAFQGYYRIYERGMFRQATEAEVRGMSRCKNATPKHLREFILSRIGEFTKLNVEDDVRQRDDAASGKAESPTSAQGQMNQDAFWRLIEESRGQAEDCNGQAAWIMAQLSKMPPSNIQAFQRHIDERRAESYRRDLWAVAYIVNGGCSDDGFEYFRGWLIAQGRDYYQAALKDPERAADRTEPGACDYQCEDILFGARQVYQQVTRVVMPQTGVTLSQEPTGTLWTENDLRKLYPTLWGRYLGNVSR